MGDYKIPRSVLVMVHTPDMYFLMIKRVRKAGFDVDFWQSVTGSLDFESEPAVDAAKRELFEETGLRADEFVFTDLQHQVRYEIFEQWRYRYAPDVTHNIESQFSVCVPTMKVPVVLAADEHTDFQWLPAEAAAEVCFSWNNADAIRRLAGLPVLVR